ncbi:MAG: tyrosine-type recombinase/integrase family protein [Desulfobacterales bacterium]|nr:tyrosine-type recombinase/integrase family protein [Desulfobacterales bacterium]
MGVKVREKVKDSNEWWIFIDHQGKRRAKKIGDKRLALEVSKKIEAKLILGDFDIDNDKEEKKIPSFNEYAQMWLTVTVSATCKPSTIDDYNIIMNKHILPVFGKKDLKEISRGMIKNFLMEKIKGGSAASMIEGGESLAYVKDQLGHHSISITVDIYGHLTPGSNKEAVDKLDDNSRRNQTQPIRNQTKKGLVLRN